MFMFCQNWLLFIIPSKTLSVYKKIQMYFLAETNCIIFFQFLWLISISDYTWSPIKTITSNLTSAFFSVFLYMLFHIFQNGGQGSVGKKETNGQNILGKINVINAHVLFPFKDLWLCLYSIPSSSSRLFWVFFVI